jgi:hypothetical protein
MVEEEEFFDPPRVQLPVLAEQQRGFGEAVRLTGRSTMSGTGRVVYPAPLQLPNRTLTRHL